MKFEELKDLYTGLQDTTKAILKKVGSKKRISEKELINLNGLKQNIKSVAVEKSPETISNVMLKALNKYAKTSKRSAKSIVFALRRNKKYLYGDFGSAKKYVDYMHGLELYSKYQPKVENSNLNFKFNNSKLNKAKKLLSKTNIDANKYYGNRNTILIDNNLYPINTGRYIKLTQNENSKLIDAFETISLFHPLIEKEARFGKITYKTTAGKTETVELAFDNLVGYELIKRRIIANLNPKEIKSISINETFKTARKTKQNCAEALTTKEIEELINSSKELTNLYFNENQPTKATKVKKEELKFDKNQKPYQLRVVSQDKVNTLSNHALSSNVVPATTPAHTEDLSQ